MVTCAMLLTSAALADEAIIDGKTSDRVHLRSGRSTASESLGLYFTGTRVLCEAEPQGDWVAVTIGNQMGYMKAEYLLPILIGELLEQKKVTVKVLPTRDRWFGVTYAADREAVAESFRALIDAGEYREDLYSDL